MFSQCLQEMLKYSKGCDGCDDLQEALSSILGILKAVNDSMHLIAITGYEVRRSTLRLQTLLEVVKSFQTACKSLMGYLAVGKWVEFAVSCVLLKYRAG